MKKTSNLKQSANLVVKFTLTTLLLLQSVFCSAKQITKEQSLNIAKQFYSEQRTSKVFKLRSATIPEFKLDYISTDKPQPLNGRALVPSVTDSLGYYYVYNIGDKQGFIIVSGDDRTKPILGYSDEGAFSTENIPEHVKAFMVNYKNQIKNVIQNNTTIELHKVMKAVIPNDSAVEPLIKTKWGQESPYNSKIPIKAYTGCGATALAQVMNYFKWPATGTSTKSYTYNSCVFSANFGTTEYKWTNMKDDYTINDDVTTIYSEAVATLMYHCGVALNMQFSSDGSNCVTTAIAPALINYFGYDKNVQLIYSSSFTSKQWKYKIKSEINAKRPVLVFGNDGSAVGHEYIADGYDKYNFIHINWGWDGDYNGYFETDPLDASIYFTPGSLIVGIQKPVSTTQISLIYQGFNFNANITLPKSLLINKTITISESKNRNFMGIIGLAFYRNENLYSIIDSSTSTITSSALFSKNYTFSIPDTLSTGTYRLVPVFKLISDTAWTEIKYKNMSSTTDTRVNENIEFVVSNSGFNIYQNSKTLNCRKGDFSKNFSFDDFNYIQRLNVSGQIDQFDLLYMASAKSITNINLENSNILTTKIDSTEIAYGNKPNSFKEFYENLYSIAKRLHDHFWHGDNYFEGSSLWDDFGNGIYYSNVKGLYYDKNKQIYFTIEKPMDTDPTKTQINVQIVGSQDEATGPGGEPYGVPIQKTKSSSVIGSIYIGGKGLMADVFSGSSIESITLPNNLKYVAPMAFTNCPNLKTISLPDSVCLIGDSLFYNCPKLTSIKFPKKIKSIYRQALSSLPNLTSVILPDSVTSLEIAQCVGTVKTITIPSTAIAIKNYAFSGCSSLTSIKIPESVTSIGVYAFSHCTGLTSIKIPESVSSIGDNTFEYCSGLTSVTIPNSVTSIGNCAFYYCNCLTSINVPSSVTAIGNYAFYHCSGLKSIYTNSIVPIDLSAKYYVFDAINKTTCTLYVPNGSKTLYQAASQWSDFTNIVELDALAVSNPKNTENKIYYNHATGSVQIDGLDKPVYVSIYDITGKLHYYGLVSGGKALQVGVLSKGIYFVKMIINNNTVSQKIMVY